ncbi:U-box domain-containing protein 27-like [Vicia villosa]|uniref:U-box domain-containing protein 27-like n=1 Tax=Vicia villosa TaxID=3911 RepID=UPI00273CAB0A|nr:U-box domain-containing protein 27-like [Vicia villosa]
MVREREKAIDLCITVPTFFKCPISLDVMKSPVSLCTGVTYDRASIQRWLDDGNNTCPATMQILKTKDFVPNRTLHSLIQIWTDSVHRRVEPPFLPSVPSKDQLLQTITDLRTSPGSPGLNRINRLGLITKAVRFGQDSDQNRAFLAKLDGFVSLMVTFLDNVDGSVEFLEQVLTALGLVLEKIEDRDGLKNDILKGKNKKCLDSMLLVLRRGSNNSRIATARVLKFIALDGESQILIAENEPLIIELLNLSKPEKDPKVIENCLSCLVAISQPKRNKVKLVKFGAMKTLSRLLTEANTTVKVVEKALKLVESASTTSEGRKEMCEDAACVAAILNKVLKVSNVATGHAVTILWSVCYLFRDQKAQEAVTQANGLTKILLLIQGYCSPQVRQMCTDLLQIFRVNSKSCLSSYETKTSHIMPF